MSRMLSAVAAAVLGLCSMGHSKEASALGYIVHVFCDAGTGVAPTGPNPNIICELTWEGSGPSMVFHVDWTGLIYDTVNPLIRDTFISPRYDMRTTAQPLITYIACSDVPGPIQSSVVAISYRTEPKPVHQEFFSSTNYIKTSIVGLNAPCTP